MKFSNKNYLFLLAFAALFLLKTPVDATELITHVNSNGDIIVAWIEYDSGCPLIKVNSKLAGGSWGTPEEVLLPNCSLGKFIVKTHPNGSDRSVVILWAAENVDRISLYSIMQEDSSSPWTSAALVSSTDEVWDPEIELIIESSGLVRALWQSLDSGTGTKYLSTATSSGFTNSWSACTVISTP